MAGRGHSVAVKVSNKTVTAKGKEYYIVVSISLHYTIRRATVSDNVATVHTLVKKVKVKWSRYAP
jgi:hypothetical protein